MGDKVLLVDTGFSAQPIYQSIQELGFDVHVVGGRPEDPLAKTAEKYWCLDYSDTDKLSELVRRENYRFIVPGCTDRSYTSCSIVSERLDLPGIEPPEIDAQINLKDKFRNLSERLGVPIPKVQKELVNPSFPVIVKPVDAFSGNGITVVNCSEQLDEALELARSCSPSNSFVCEEYLQGQLYSHSAFVKDGKVAVDFIVREDSTAYPFAVDLSCVESDYSKALLGEMRQSIESIVAELSLLDGLMHTQFIQADGQVYLIEMTRRCPGDLYSSLIELQTGFHYTDNYVRTFLGLEIEPVQPSQTDCAVVRHTVSSKSAIAFNGIRYLEPVQMEKWVPLAVKGEQLLPSPKGRIGIAFMRCKGSPELEKLYSSLLRRELYELF
jgi:biotin carboxylase